MRLIIISASSRYLVESAIRAGIRVQAFDFFADWDLKKLGNLRFGEGYRVRKVQGFQQAADQSVKSALDTHFDGTILGGGIENLPKIVQAISFQTILIGTQPNALSRLHDVNSPSSVSVCVTKSAVEYPSARFPRCKPSLCRLDQPDRWLRKKLGGAGGQHVRVGDVLDLGGAAEPGCFFQERVHGRQVSAIYLVKHRDERRDCELLGLTRQLVGEQKLGAQPFAYCGSIGPISVASKVLRSIECIGQGLSTEFEIDGVFGIDFIVGLDDSEIWPVDINPRIPSSAEVVELGLQESADELSGGWAVSIVGRHVQACTGWRTDGPAPHPTIRPESGFQSDCDSRPMFGKAVVFCQNPQGVDIGNDQFESIRDLHGGDLVGRNLKVRWVADIPNAGQRIEAGQPVVTLLVRGESENGVYDSLVGFAKEFRDLIGC